MTDEPPMNTPTPPPPSDAVDAPVRTPPPSDAVDAPTPTPDVAYFVNEIKTTADKLLADGVSRGDIKLLSTALKELRYAFKVFARYRHVRKVTVFGSARTPPEHPAYRQAVWFGQRMAASEWMVITGAAAGIMEAGHIGAGRAMSIGLNIILPFETGANSVIAGDPKLMNLKYFFTRKLLFLKESDAIVLFPGGFGTHDECFEVLTLIQTGKSHLIPVVLLDEPGGTYWQQFMRFIREGLLERGYISPEDLAFIKTTDSVDEAVAEVTRFYRVYHSMRYIRKDLVLRLNYPLPSATLDRLNAEFAELATGPFVQTEAHPVEANESHIRHLPRLRFRFNRRNFGRLRQLIDAINASPIEQAVSQPGQPGQPGQPSQLGQLSQSGQPGQPLG